MGAESDLMVLGAPNGLYFCPPRMTERRLRRRSMWRRGVFRESVSVNVGRTNTLNCLEQRRDMTRNGDQRLMEGLAQVTRKDQVELVV